MTSMPKVPKPANDLSVPSAHSDDMHTRLRLERSRQAIANKDFQEAAQLLDPEMLPETVDPALQVEWAAALFGARAYDQSDMLFERLLTRHRGNRGVHVSYAKQLYHGGLLRQAHDVLDSVSHLLGEGSKSLSLYNRIKRLLALLDEKEGAALRPRDDGRLLAMKHATLAYRNRHVRTIPDGTLGRITLVTGSLGPGGAERQLSRTAAQLERRRLRGESIAGITIERQVEVLVRSHGPEQQHDFFLPDLLDADVALAEINKMEPVPPSKFDIEDKELKILLEYLPSKVNFGIRRLVPHFLASKPDVVSIWQDGACLFAALAAIIAGVPKIQLAIRGFPPSQRRHLFQPEYEEMYRTLAQIPGVQFLSNSKAAARAYAEWLDIPVERFDIVYNGVGKMDAQRTPELERQWKDFVASTADADHTIGGVFRFDTDKRPATWIRFAARYARKHPNSRFLLVGGGRLLDAAKEQAAKLGIADRILFVGRTTDVGFWVEHFDVMVLMSRFEGLPNVLIEAQFMGIPVVSTPAGGAAECFIEGVTGHILGSAEETDLDEACKKANDLVGRAHDPAIFGPVSRNFLTENFSISRMLENFVSLISSPATTKAQAAMRLKVARSR